MGRREIEGGPLRNERVDRSSPLRSRPEFLPEVLGPDLDQVLAACVNLVEEVRRVFNRVEEPGSSVVNETQTRTGRRQGRS